jgi:hypothetical protein
MVGRRPEGRPESPLLLGNVSLSAGISISGWADERREPYSKRLCNATLDNGGLAPYSRHHVVKTFSQADRLLRGTKGERDVS